MSISLSQEQKESLYGWGPGVLTPSEVDEVAIRVQNYTVEHGSMPRDALERICRRRIELGSTETNQVIEFFGHSGLLIEPVQQKPADQMADDLDETQLDRLVLDEEKRTEIEAVLKQHKFQHIIFQEWGLEEVIEYGKGMTMLFWGPPGTGKTWAATCIAKALKKELMIITPSQIQSSEPGGTNRAIEAAFAEAESSKKVLFFDECDSLIGNRENVGMILGSEINTLLTSIEKSEGVCILCTNMIGNLDKALERRISLILEFPEPNEEQRTEIWRKMLPAKMPLEDGITPELLAQAELTGGQIKNTVLSAARKAVAENAPRVMKKHFASAIKNISNSSGVMGKPNIRKSTRPMSDAGVSTGAQADTEKVKRKVKTKAPKNGTKK